MIRYSGNYVTTLNASSSVDMEKLAAIRAGIKEFNKFSALSGKKGSRVVVRGRKPKVKVNGKSYDWGGNIVGGIKNATYLDVYIYDRS